MIRHGVVVRPAVSGRWPVLVLLGRGVVVLLDRCGGRGRERRGRCDGRLREEPGHVWRRPRLVARGLVALLVDRSRGGPGRWVVALRKWLLLSQRVGLVVNAGVFAVLAVVVVGRVGVDVIVVDQGRRWDVDAGARDLEASLTRSVFHLWTDMISKDWSAVQKDWLLRLISSAGPSRFIILHSPRNTKYILPWMKSNQGVTTHDVLCTTYLDIRLISGCWIRSKHGCF